MSCVHPYDAELMDKVGEVGCLEAGVVILARCLSIMQHQRRAVEGHSGLHDRVSDLERQFADHTQARKTLETELEDIKRVVAEKEHALTEKESQMTHLQGLCD